MAQSTLSTRRMKMVVSLAFGVLYALSLISSCVASLKKEDCEGNSNKQ
jgi:hypothetical protein